MFQWQTNGSMSMAKSSNIAAVWILKSERGGAIAGPPWVQDPASTIERHTERRWEPETWAHRQGMGRACICDWSPRPQGAWSVQHTAAEDMASTRLRGGIEEEWGSWQSAPEVKCSRAPTGQFLQMERGLCLHYTVLVSVNCAELCASWVLKNQHLVQPFAYTGLPLGSVIPNQHVTINLCRLSEPYFEHVDAQVCKDTWLNHSERCTKGCKSPLDAVFGFECSSQFICDNASMKCWNNREHTEEGALLCRVEKMLYHFKGNTWVQEVKDRKSKALFTCFDIWAIPCRLAREVLVDILLKWVIVSDLRCSSSDWCYDSNEPVIVSVPVYSKLT